MLKKVQIFKALDIEIKKQKGPAAVKEVYRGHHSLKEELSQPGITIVAEVAGGNPIRGQVRENYRPGTHAKSLVENGARVISVATDRFLYFGEDHHLSDTRSVVKVPLLRRDFIFEEYQIEESKILGADAVFLMAALLETDRLVALMKLAALKGLDVVVEIASEADLKRALDANADIICVVGRNLDTWEPSWAFALDLLKRVPAKKCFRMVEAGVTTLAQIRELESLGVHGVVIGDPLLDEFYPGKRLAQLLAGQEPIRKSPKGKPKAKPVSIPAGTEAVGSQILEEAVPSTPQRAESPAKRPAPEPPSTASPHPAPKGKKEPPMQQSTRPEPAVDTATSGTSAEPMIAAKKAAPKKPVSKKAVAAPKKAAPKKPVAKKAVAAPKKAAPKKPVAKQAVAAPKKPVAKQAVAAPKKAAPKKPVAKKAAPKKPVAKKAVAAPKKAAPKKPVAKKAAATPKKAAPKKPVAKKAVAAPKKAAPKKPVTKKAVAAPKKAAPKKPVAQKAVAAPKKATAKK